MSAKFSPCRTWRYTLTRVINAFAEHPLMTFCMLNPSTADETQDDPTIRRCIGFAHRTGVKALVIVNLFAFRSTDPKGLLATPDPVGRENDKAIRDAFLGSSYFVAAWGAFGLANERGQVVIDMLCAMGMKRKILCLGKNGDGSPRHPLYVKADQAFEEFATIQKRKGV